MPDARDPGPLMDEPLEDDDDLIDVLDEDDEGGSDLEVEAIQEDEPRRGRIDRASDLA